MKESVLVFDPTSVEFQVNRHEVFKRFREQDAVHGQPMQLLSGKQSTRWMITSYDDVAFVLKDSRFVREIDKVLKQEKSPIPPAIETLIKAQNNQMLFKDPPDHTRLRSLVNQAFTPKMIQKLDTRIEEIATYLLQEVHHCSSFDVISDYAFPLPVIVIAELLGIPPEDRELFKKWSNIFIKTIDYNPSMDVLVEGNGAMIEFREYFRNIVRERTNQPKDDLISNLILARDEGGKLSEEELLDMCSLLLVAGHETTINLIANSILLLLQHREQLQLLKSQPELLSSAIEEVLRFESPVQLVGRSVGEDIEIRGKQLRQGDYVIAWVASANRDPNHFEAPEIFDITRKNNKHLAFGQGIHFCLGAPLARMEGSIALRAFLNTFPNALLASDRIEWTPAPLMRGLKELRVKV